MSLIKEVAKKAFKKIPFRLQVVLARNQPGWAFHINKSPRSIQIDYFLGKYRVNIDTSVDLERRFLSGLYEPATMAIIKRFVKPGHTCLDIGANVGAISFALADAAAPDGVVHAFEPGPSFSKRLHANLKLNPNLERRVRVHEVGLSNEPGKLQWQQSYVYTGTASMYKGVREDAHPTIELPVVRLDDFTAVSEAPSVHFIKMDVDGLELEILQGGLNLIKRHMPVLYIETTMWDEPMKAAAAGIDKLLTELGYDLYKVNERTAEISKTRYPDFSACTLALFKK